MGGHWFGRIAATVALLVAVPAGSPTSTGAGAPQAPAPPPGPFVSLLFSRTEITGAIGCTSDSRGVARLDRVVAPYLQSLGFAATGTLVTGRIHPNYKACTHNQSSLMASWADAGRLAEGFGWHFVSHTATYPASLNTLSPQQSWDETCGSANSIAAHGLPGGNGLIAYPGAQGLPVQLQTDYGANCFAWGRRYNSSATTSSSAAATPPYWQHTAAPGGGPCNDPAAACYAGTGPRYVLPSVQIAHVQTLQPGMWMTLQAFILVRGVSPAESPIKWDCTSPDPTEHWTTDNERYCYRDWRAIVQAIAGRPDITVTDPLTVGIAFGRPGTYSYPRP